MLKLIMEILGTSNYGNWRVLKIWQVPPSIISPILDTLIAVMLIPILSIPGTAALETDLSITYNYVNNTLWYVSERIHTYCYVIDFKHSEIIFFGFLSAASINIHTCTQCFHREWLRKSMVAIFTRNYVTMSNPIRMLLGGISRSKYILLVKSGYITNKWINIWKNISKFILTVISIVHMTKRPEKSILVL